jgi:uncharacterized membrane protein
MRIAGYLVLVLLSLAVAGYAIYVYGFMPLGVFVHPEMRDNFRAHPAGILLHVFGAAVAMALGPFQFSTRLRAKYPTVHRWSGRLYLGVGVLVGGAAGLYMAFHAWGGIVAKLGFACLAIAWLYTGFAAYQAIRAGDVVLHRRWMVRNFALTFAAVMLRIYLPASFAFSLDANVSYPIIAWLCWAPNLIVAEWCFNRRTGHAV